MFEKCYDGATNTKIFFAIFFFIIKELWASNALRVSLFMLIMFSSFVNKKKLNIERFEKELFEFIDTKYAEIPRAIAQEQAISDATEELLVKAITEFKAQF